MRRRLSRHPLRVGWGHRRNEDVGRVGVEKIGVRAASRLDKRVQIV